MVVLMASPVVGVCFGKFISAGKVSGIRNGMVGRGRISMGGISMGIGRISMGLLGGGI